ncbi:MAG: hypothetical protein IT369_08800 [Candidatus Latescibacteria bacterium]|nr:hypothetical protein [Candidatus Latescibacterota bacterium]
MTVWVAFAWAFLLSFARGGVAEAQPTSFSIPGDISWAEAKQLPFNPVNFFESIDYTLDAEGVAPLDTTQMVAVPSFPDSILSPDQFSFQQRREFQAFTRHVARDSVFALQAVVADGKTLVEKGGLLIPAFGDFPADLVGVRLLRQAGVEEVRALVNLVNAILWPRDPQKRFETVLRSPTLYERQLNARQQRDLLERLIDGDPNTAFSRLDKPNRPAVKSSVVILMDLISRFPVGLVRFYPRPVSDSPRISAYGLEANDGIAVRGGQSGDARQVTGFSYELLGSQAAVKVEGEPVYKPLRTSQGNVEDTVAVRMEPPQYLQRFRFRSLTGLDYEIAEMEVFNYGFPPNAVYVSRALPVDKRALPLLGSYLNFKGDLRTSAEFERLQGIRAKLDLLEGGTLGRIFWEEEKVGDPAKSTAVVSMQTGLTPEPLVLLRLNVPNGDAVEWRPNAQVVDHRSGSFTLGQKVDLDNPLLRGSARDIWNALSNAERAAAQTTSPEYNATPAVIAAANKADKKTNPLPLLRDEVSWSGFQAVRNGQLITLPGERPFFQLRVDFTSSDPRAATLVKNLRFEQVFPALLRQVQAEVVPAAEVQAGLDTLFTYALRPSLRDGDAGFNRLRISTPTRISAIEKVEFGFGLGEAGQLRRREEVDFRRELEPVVTDSFFILGLPRVNAATAPKDSLVVLVQFRDRVLNAKTTFAGQVFLDTLGSRDSTSFSDVVVLLKRDPATSQLDTLAQIVPQRVVEGNVLGFGETTGDRNTLSVVTSVAQGIQSVIMRVQVSPNPFTPNGDGVNDATAISFDVLRVVQPVPVDVEIYDLSGRLMRRWTQLRKVGEATVLWNGQDGEGHLVPPGMYLAKLSAGTSAGDFAAIRLVSLVY